MNKIYATRVEVVDTPTGEEIVVAFTKELLDELALKNGDVLTWEIDTEKATVRKYRQKEEN